MGVRDLLLFEASAKFGVSIHAWVFMTNHVHLLMTPTCWSGISRTMQYLGRYYVRYFNFTHKRSGTLYQGRFKSSIVQDRQYLLACQRYIELNPVRAGMVNDPEKSNPGNQTRARSPRCSQRSFRDRAGRALYRPQATRGVDRPMKPVRHTSSRNSR